MAKITDTNERMKLRSIIMNKLNLYDQERRERSFHYHLREQFYAGDVRPDVGEGHEEIKTELASAIADKMSAYVGVNAPEINILSKDINDDVLTYEAQVVEEILGDIYDEFFEEMFLDANEGASRLGDGFIGTDVKNGVPYHYHIERPENVSVIWKTDNYKEHDCWAYIFGITKEAAKEIFKEDFAPIMNEVELSNVIEGKRTGKALFGLSLPGRTNKDRTDKFVKITDFHTYIDLYDEEGKIAIPAGTNVIMVNDMPVETKADKAKNLYHFIANSFPRMSTGTCDFEHSAHMVTMLDKKLSEEADSVSQGVYHKFFTNDRSIAKLQDKFMPNKTQIITGSDDTSRLEVLKLNSNSYNSEPLVKNLLNVIRTTTNLQELAQDQVSPNISGRALALIYQGVIQSVGKKRKRWQRIIKQMVIDDMWMLSESDSKLRQIAFLPDGTFKFRIQINWPEVLEQDKQTIVTTVQAMRQGARPLISTYSAMQKVGIPDPVQELKRIEKERAEDMAFEQAVMGTAMQPSNPEGPILSESQNQGEGIPSMEGMPGSAQTTVSPQGASNMKAQKSSAKGGK
jgi:hypothetical protein